MTTATSNQLSETMQSFKSAAEQAISSCDVNDFVALEKFVTDCEAFCREMQQSFWADEAKNLIAALEGGTELSQTDRETLRTFLISDAEFYLEMENNYGDWVNELNRICDDCVRRANSADKFNIGELRGTLKDAERLIPDLRNFCEEKQRVQKFNDAMDTLDKSSRQMLARLIREQLASEKR